MAQFLRLIHICEARGSGFDRMEEGMRDLKIPATKVESGEDFCRILLYWHKSFADWSKEERIKTLVSRVIKDTVTAGLIKLFDETTAPRYYKYIPYWA